MRLHTRIRGTLRLALALLLAAPILPARDAGAGALDAPKKAADAAKKADAAAKQAGAAANKAGLGGGEGESEGGAAPAAAGGEGPRGDACTYPVDLMWHREPKDGDWQMGVSVLNKANGQQVPGLNSEHFAIALDETAVSSDPGNLKVRQSKNAFDLMSSEAGAAPAAGAVDPVSYDVYFAVDMTESMGQVLELQGKKRTQLSWTLSLVNGLVQPDKAGNALFDEKDRVYISGFTSKLETGFMESTTADRTKIRAALGKINEMTPSGADAALYASLLHNLSNIKSQAAEYKDPAKKRQAVLIVVTDSFNGFDLSAKRRLRGCSENDPLTDQVRQAVLDTQTAVGDNLKLYLLGLGKEGETDSYKLGQPAGRKCRIADAQKQVLDGRSLRAIGDPGLTHGGYVASANPVELAAYVKSQFEGLKNAYELAYAPPEGALRPRTFKVRVTLGEHVCEDVAEIETTIIPQARAADLATSPGEVALFLASLIVVLFFLPRTFSNLATLGGSGGQAAKKPAKSSKGKKKPGKKKG